MACTHLRKLYRLCQEQEIYFGGADLVRIVCAQCEAEEVCPTSLTLETSDEPESIDGNTEKSGDAS